MKDEDLLQQFVSAFGPSDEMLPYDAPILSGGVVPAWKAAAIHTDASVPAAFYERLPARLPPLYERLILSYGWPEVEPAGLLRLLANPPGPDLSPLLANMTEDPALVEVLFPLGLIPFGRAPGVCYDPVCFDTRRRGPDGDCPVVRIEHEAVLCEGRVGDRWDLADSFRSLVGAVVAKAVAPRDT